MHQDGPSVSVRTGGRAVAYYRDILTLASHTTAGKDEPTRPSGERPLPAHHDAVVLALGGGQQLVLGLLFLLWWRVRPLKVSLREPD